MSAATKLDVGCKHKNVRLKRLQAPIRSKAQLQAAWERPFTEGMSTCFNRNSIVDNFQPKSRHTVTSLQSKFSTTLRTRRPTGRSPKFDNRIEERARIGRIYPSPVVPSRYRLCLKPYLESFKFDGSVLIEFGCMSCPESQTDMDGPPSVTTLVLNALDLTIGKVVWTDSTTMNQWEPSSVTLDPETEQLTLTFSQPMSLPGVLIINFSGQIGNGTVGFYRSKYVNSVGEDKYCGVTKFEPTFARKCFPCWDEPGYKSKFDLSIILPKHLTALSNQPVQIIGPHRTNKNLHVIEFETTPVMSTHLLAFIIGDFESITGHIGSGADFVNICLHTSLGQADKGQVALTWTKAFLEFYQSYFDLPMAMRKLDLVTLTSHALGSMGNWGLITFHEGQILQQDEDDLEETTRIALVVSHATVHQWIGNLVTMDWWTGLWLKEGLATFLDYFSMDYLKPTFNLWQNFTADVMVRALEADTLRNTHALDAEVHYPSEIKEIFDDISFGKGAAIMRMIQNFVGDRTFQQGIQDYVKRFAHRSASSKDFFQIMEDISGKSITTVFESWVKYPGFPLIRVDPSQFEPNGTSTTRVVVVHQESFSIEPVYGHTTGRRHKWVIPIHMSLSSAPSLPVKEFVMDKRNQKFKILDSTVNDWFLLNPGFIGFYRVKYSPDLITHFLQAIRSKVLAPVDRLGLLNDLHALCTAGISMTTELITMLESFLLEDDYLIWKEISLVLGSLDLLLQNTEIYSKFKAFTRYLFKKIYEKLGSNPKPGESSADTKLRLLVLRRLLQFRQKECLEEGFRAFRNWLTGGSIELRGIAFQAGIIDSENSDEVFRTLVRYFRDSKSTQEKQDVIQAFGYAQSEEVIMSILEFTASDLVNSEETVVLMETLMQNAVAKPLAWQFFTDNITTFQKRFPPGCDLGQRLIEGVTKYLGKEVKTKQVAAFFTRHPFFGMDKVIQAGLDKMKLYSIWLKRDYARLAEYLTPYED